MKTNTLICLLFLIASLFTYFSVEAQAPQRFKYQAAVRDASGNPLGGQQISLRVSILSGDPNGLPVYSETHAAQTNSLGLFSLSVGSGTLPNGDFQEIDWGAGAHFLRVEVDPEGGSNFSLLGTQQLLAVPYALFSERVANADDADADPENEIQAIDYDPITNILTLSNGGQVDLSDLEGGAGADFQTLALNGTILSIEDGNAVDLSIIQDGTQDADSNPTNELQFLNLNGNQLSIGPSGSATVTLPSDGASLWSPAGDDIFYDQGDVFADRSLIVGDDILVQNLDDPDGFLGAEISSFEDGEGRIFTYGANGSTNVGLLSTGNFNDGGISLYNQNDEEQLAIGINSGNAGFLETYAPNGSANIIAGSQADNDNIGWLGLQDQDGFTQVYLTTVDGSGQGYLETAGPNGNQNVQLTASSANANQGYVSVSEQGGFEAVAISVLPSGEGFAATVGANGYDNIQLSSLENYPDNGFVAVLDDFGDIRAGTYIDEFGDGIVFGDIKNFRVPHPGQPGKEIWYASLEGPEAAAYLRGTGQLTQGAAFVEFPEHFRAIAGPETMTVMLTPLSADTRGLAVVEKTTDGFRVKELMNGQGSFSFDWEVKCVRKGYENFRVVRDRSSIRTAARPVAQKQRPGRASYEKREEVQKKAESQRAAPRHDK